MKRILLFIIWLGFIFYSVFIAPSGNGNYLSDLITMNDPDPGLLAMFSLLGVWPAVFAILLLRSDRGSVPAWPFVLGSFVLGAFSLLPYFILNRKVERANRIPVKLQRFLSSNALAVILMLVTIFLMGYGIMGREPGVYETAFLESNFVHVMTIDFVVLTFLSILALRDRDQVTGLYGFIPIIGPLIVTMKK
ncbi:hypothetical protein JI666_08530 [Bacillus sp. NTK071]|uniref:hypothetical protein n=1 Tax=Bacillus sp. NTK071 TaxID=2802175 RepID=UPI001A902691|nr:hypothetical protein [Bacillus sp. NTK071]MBN8208791.1 hypothetical protein [Bacillus sp. NTK071]